MKSELIISCILLHSLGFAQYERPGSSDAQFLKIGTSARATGMGGAYIAIADGAEATYYNPAALARITGTRVLFNHNAWFAGINHDFFAIAHTTKAFGTFGFSMTALVTDAMKVRTPLQPDGTGETFSAGNYRFGLSYARAMNSFVTFGGTVNFIHMSLYSGFTADAISGEISVLYHTDYRGFRFGMRIANFGTDITYVNESYPLPTNFTFGMAFDIIDRPDQKLLLGISAVKPNDGKPLGQLGLEWNLRDTYFIRGGYPLNHDVASFSFGAGLKMTIGERQFNFDYAYSDFGLLQGAQQVGIGIAL